MCAVVCGFVRGGCPHRPWPGGNSEQRLRCQDGTGFGAKPRVTEAQFFLHLYLNEAFGGTFMALLTTRLVAYVGLFCIPFSCVCFFPLGKL